MLEMNLKEIENLAMKDGLAGDLVLEQTALPVNLYNPFTQTILLKEYRNVDRCAFRLSHEIKHQIDLQYWSPWLNIAVYFGPMIAIGVWSGSVFGWQFGLVGLVLAYFFHPFEIRANLYALKNWTRYRQFISSPSP